MENIQNQLLVYFHDLTQIIASRGKDFGTENFNLITIIFLFILLVVFLMGLTFGRSRMLLGLLSLYVARLGELNFVYFGYVRNWFPNVDDRWLHFAVFVIFAMITFVLLQKSVLRNRLSLGDASILPVTILSLLTIGFFATVAFSYLPGEFYKGIDPNILRYFTTETAHFWWTAAPILSVIFLRRRDG